MVCVSELAGIHIVALTHQSLSFKAHKSPVMIALHTGTRVNALRGTLCSLGSSLPAAEGKALSENPKDKLIRIYRGKGPTLAVVTEH